MKIIYDDIYIENPREAMINNDKNKLYNKSVG